jgi:hypothetical protein
MSDDLSKARLERVAELLQRHHVQFSVIGGQDHFSNSSQSNTFVKKPG